ncbi:hypothetical protein ACFFJX_08950 [Pseudarcicella hirudinis]|uniref:hypothetical protein n=1 Tax=Pseudarcicella hirudinis TaxID=1079859 RepID=UPI0035EC1998
MKKYLLPLLVLLTHSLQAQEPAKKEEPKPVIAASQSVNPVITKHQTTINGQTFSYTATTGYMTLKDESGKAKANIFTLPIQKTE